MMKTMSRLALAVAVVCAFVVAAQAGQGQEVTLKGDIACAHCTFHVSGVKECQDALQVTNADGTKAFYMIAKNDVLTKFGHTCQGTKSVTVTGTLADKKGQKWITPSKIEEMKG